MTGISRTVATRDAGGNPGRRELPEEVAVALSYNGSTQAVMMATPADLPDFARGFTLTEGIADPAEIEEIAVVEVPRGIDLQIWLAEGAAERLADRRRSRAGPVGCGLCGIDSLEEAVRDIRPVPASPLRLSPAGVTTAMAAMSPAQPLHVATRAAHAAGFWLPGQGLALIREDVGRHNALDKLAGAMLAAGLNASEGALVITSRVSLDMVQKAAAIGAPVLIAAAAPTAAAVALADSTGITIAALARGDRFELFTHMSRVPGGDVADVA